MTDREQRAARVAIYVRISDDREGAGLGVERQERECRELAARLGWRVVEVYADNDLSAYSGKPRTGYLRMLEDIRAGHVDAVIAWHNDRLHRSPAELEEFIALLEQQRTLVSTVKVGDMDLSTPAGRMIARQLGTIARYESEHKAERLISKHAELAAAGKATGGGFRPYGYRRIYDRPDRPHRVVREEVVEEEAEVIRDCARRLLAGEAINAVCRDLNERGVPTSTGGAWSRSTLARLMASARISGRREHRPRARHETRRIMIGEITGTGQWPSIITPAESDRLRAMLADPDRRVSPGRTGRYLLTGVLVCGRCETVMVGKSRGAGRGRLYLCDGQPGRGCGRISVGGPGADAEVAAWVAQALSSAELRQRLTAVARPDEGALLAEIAASEAELEELAALLGARQMTRAEWLAARGPVQARIEEARRQLAQVDTVRALDGVPVGYDELLGFLLDERLEASRRRAVLLTALERVRVGPAVRGRHRFDPTRLSPQWVTGTG